MRVKTTQNSDKSDWVKVNITKAKNPWMQSLYPEFSPRFRFRSRLESRYFMKILDYNDTDIFPTYMTKLHIQGIHNQQLVMNGEIIFNK